jgi:ATP-binding cassette subfamily C (CFTR/MRP) protein 1
VDYALFFATQLAFVAHTYYNHFTSRRSSDLILLFWPIYVLVAAVRVRTMIITGALSLGMQASDEGKLVLAREICWLSSIGIGLISFSLELFSPEKRWKKMKWMRGGGKIRLDDSDEDESDDEGTAIKNEDGDMESPVVTANLFERLTFSWLTRESSAQPAI